LSFFFQIPDIFFLIKATRNELTVTEAVFLEGFIPREGNKNKGNT
jgi:hypothetical protein